MVSPYNTAFCQGSVFFILQGRDPLFVPCTPLGCIELLDRIGTQIAGKRAVVVGRSNIVGMPVALLLNKRNATVTICHSATKDMAQCVREADIVVAAAGQAGLVKVSKHGTPCPLQVIASTYLMLRQMATTQAIWGFFLA
jgi:5,10-methylene-tetrahydrofolate dehydrogenase/methenyl tetrahydrofolate cyclohydrolase